jgi:phenylacetate-CoA ligase
MASQAESIVVRPGHLRDEVLDRGSRSAYAAVAASALRAQVEYIREHQVPFWQERLDAAGLAGDGFGADAWHGLPPMTKDTLRATPPWQLVPKLNRRRISRCFGTSGTSGFPTFAMWSSDDWRALTETVARAISRQRPISEVVALNGYHQAHTAGSAYDGAVRLMGGISIPRHYLMDDEEATCAQIQLLHCDTLILAERSGQQKSGRSVEDLLRWDPNLFSRCGIRWWIGSSTTFTARMREIAQAQGVLAVTNLYGSSEFGMLGVSCAVQPKQFHLLLGHVLVEVVDDKGEPVSSGQRGRILASLIFSTRAEGGVGPHEGTQLLRFENGDRATYLDGPCACGLQSPRIMDLVRS